MRVVLYNVGRNLNRAYRTCYSFGIYNLYLIECDDSKMDMGLFSAKDKVKINICSFDDIDMNKTVALENYYDYPIQDVDWTDIEYILIGGESRGLPKKIKPKIKACIKTDNNFCLTVEASLAIALYEWKNKC